MTRKPSLEVAPTTLRVIGTHTISNSGPFIFHVGCIFSLSAEKKFFCDLELSAVIFTQELDLVRVKMHHHAKHISQR